MGYAGVDGRISRKSDEVSGNLKENLMIVSRCQTIDYKSLVRPMQKMLAIGRLFWQ
jgi:glycerol-3-phosphate responsive antiterminator